MLAAVGDERSEVFGCLPICVFSNLWELAD